MARTIGTGELAALLAGPEPVQLVDVLPTSDYDLEHLPGSRSLPLTALSRRRAHELDPSKPVVVYCFDFQ